MGKRKIKPEKQLADAVKGLQESLKSWVEIAQDGSSDPGWQDGVNMNLCRNHITCHKSVIKSVCEEHALPVPAEYDLPDPPYVDSNYFAHPESERAQKIMNQFNWRCCNQETPQDPALFLKELSDKGLLQTRLNDEKAVTPTPARSSATA